MKSFAAERIIILFLSIALGVIVGLWRPWNAANAQRITVTGTATIKQAPDEFIFNPTYIKKAATAKEAVSQVSELGNATVAHLKSLGLSDSDLTTSVTSNQGYDAIPLSEDSAVSGVPAPIRPITKDYSATYQITATVHDKAVAQKVLDYIVTTPVLYTITPQSTFSQETKKKLESQARLEGVKDARQKALDTAEGLGAKLGTLVSVSESDRGGRVMPYYSAGSAKSVAADSATTTPVLETGVQEITYSVTVVYSLR